MGEGTVTGSGVPAVEGLARPSPVQAERAEDARGLQKAPRMSWYATLGDPSTEDLPGVAACSA
jgi:hypothetical protein